MATRQRNTVGAYSLMAIVMLAGVSCRRATDPLDDQPAGVPVAFGSVKGHVQVEGSLPAREPIRMRADLMCDRANNGERVFDDAIEADSNGALANTFVQLDGTFPDSPVPTEPVIVDQRGCMYRPRVVAIRAGQPIEVRNGNKGLHNVHGVSKGDEFNVSQPEAGMRNVFRPRQPGMLQLKCDVHTWMTAFVGVVPHPFFAVSSADGSFSMERVPIGTYQVHAWHEVFGDKTAVVNVVAGVAADVTIIFDATRHGGSSPGS